MSVFKTAKSPYYQYDFQLNGVRYNGSTKRTSLKDARAEELRLKEEARDEQKKLDLLINGPLTVQSAIGRYWMEVGERHSGASDTLRDLKRLQTYFKPSTLLSDITDKEVAAFVAWRASQRVKNRKPKKGEELPFVSNATVNRTTTDLLKKLFNRAKRTWKYNFPNEPLWKDHELKEPVERVRELDANEAEALDASVRDDYADWFEFARLTGARRQETLIRWSDVNFTSGWITRPGKGGLPVRTPITTAIRAILDRCRGHHEEWVFTYVCKSPREGQKKGKRYPLTKEGVKTQWRRLRKRSKVNNFRFHDIRHDVATKVLRREKNLKTVQKVLNQRDIESTLRYAHVLDEDVSNALESFGESQKKSQKKPKKVA